MIWNEENGIYSPNVTEICNRFHKIIEIVSNEIIDEKELKNRQKKYKFFYKLTCCLWDLGNFQGAMCISSALVSSSIYRLKLTKSIISENSIEFQKMSEIHEYLREGRNFQSYRKMLKDIKYCVLPYNGMPMSDIVFVCERTPLLVNPGEINWKCISLQSEIFDEFLRFQNEF